MFTLKHKPFRQSELTVRQFTVIIMFLWLVMFVFPFSGIRAQEPAPTPITVTDDQVNIIAREMYCPVCENTPLDVCPTQACAEWRELIRDKLAEGWSGDQIEAYFIERFGDRVSATPPPRGFNWLAYIVPPLAFTAGSIILFRSIRRQNRKTDGDADNRELTSDVPQDSYIERLEDELRKL